MYPALNTLTKQDLSQMLQIIAEEVNVKEVEFIKDNGETIMYCKQR